jgi:N-formylglutamate deformylase
LRTKTKEEVSNSVFRIISPTTSEVPILLSVPHCGVQFPPELTDQYKLSMRSAPDDTDWFVDELYNFVSEIGITMIAANYSRWVIDLNRDPQSKPLYTDGRIITALCPTTDFLGTPIYNDERKEVDGKEVERRVELYYRPYHKEIETQLSRLKNKYGKVLLWDCHSIRQQVLTINKDKFPDLILGDADETSASTDIINIAWRNLSTSGFKASHNHPFKGGYITRHYGKPNENQHALQLEMSKVNYMDDAETKYDKKRADIVRNVLRKTLVELIGALTVR